MPLRDTVVGPSERSVSADAPLVGANHFHGPRHLLDGHVDEHDDVRPRSRRFVVILREGKSPLLACSIHEVCTAETQRKKMNGNAGLKIQDAGFKMLGS